MILRIVIAQVANNAPQTFQSFVVVYVGVMSHCTCGTIIVEHLAVNEIVSSLLHLYMTRFWVVLDAAFFVLHCPVSNGPKSWERKKKWCRSFSCRNRSYRRIFPKVLKFHCGNIYFYTIYARTREKIYLDICVFFRRQPDGYFRSSEEKEISLMHEWAPRSKLAGLFKFNPPPPPHTHTSSSPSAKLLLICPTLNKSSLHPPSPYRTYSIQKVYLEQL